MPDLSPLIATAQNQPAEMTEISETPPLQRRRRWRTKKWELVALRYGLPALLAVVVVSFGYFLTRAPKDDAPEDMDPRSSTVTVSKSGNLDVADPELELKSSKILGTMAKPKAKSKVPAPEAPRTISPADAAKMELAEISKASGPLYNARNTNMALLFEALPLSAAIVSEARAVLMEYLQTKDYHERLAFVFNAEKCAPLMQQHYEKRAVKDPECGQLLGAGYITTGSSKVLYLILECATRPDSGLRANFHFTRAGKPMLDWESWAAWCEMSWADLKKERPQRSVVMRAVASESSYYNYEFSEDWRWLAVKLRSADGLQNVTGYVSRDSAAGIAMANLIGVALPHNLPQETPLPQMRGVGAKSLVTVRLAYPPNGQSDHCVKISELMADRWLLFPGEEK